MEEAHPDLLLAIRSTYDGPLSIARDMMVWNITRDGVKERMAVSPDRASAVPGPTPQPPPEPGRPDPMSDFIRAGEWGPGFNAQNEMLDEHMKRFNLQDRDWRPSKPWYQPNR
jgi:ribonuclease Z